MSHTFAALAPSYSTFNHQSTNNDQNHQRHNTYLKEKFLNRKRNNRKDYVLPTKFLLGGNINDPLNLASLYNNDVNQITPVSSPITKPKHKKEIDVLIPADLNDPLKLNNCEMQESSQLCHLLISPNVKKRKNKRKRTKSDSLIDLKDHEDQINRNNKILDKRLKLNTSSPINNLIEEFNRTNSSIKNKQIVNNNLNKTSCNNYCDKIVSPVIPQGNSTIHHNKRKNDHHLNQNKTKSNFNNNASIYNNNLGNCSASNSFSNISTDSTSIFKSKNNTNNQQNLFGTKHCYFNINNRDFSNKDKKFQYGNYNRYYGYRNQNSNQDIRLSKFQKSWFENKDVLDIGCNVGHVTLSIAQNFKPRSIIGLDIDQDLIKAAKKNIRFYNVNEMDKNYFPISLFLYNGPLTRNKKSYFKNDLFENKEKNINFPSNVCFITANYVLSNDEEMSKQKPEFDCILCLSVTKWIHLNWGDEGLKETFKRVYLQLRPGGKFIMEPQPWSSYKKRKNLTKTTLSNYNSIKLKPEKFNEYLLSNDIGFNHCEKIDPPDHQSNGFRRPIFVLTKLK